MAPRKATWRTLKQQAMMICHRWLVASVCLTLAFPPLMIVESIFMAEIATAQTYSIGYKKYRKGDLNGAKRSLIGALRAKQSRMARANTYKLLGIIQFTLGQKPNAAASFRAALKFYPKLSISTNEVLDNSVIAFFNQQKAGSNNKPKQVSPPPATAGLAPSSKQAKSTTVLISSNVKASISIDGILAGQSNQPIETDPGTLIIEVNASGFIPKKLKVAAVKGQQREYKVVMEKPKPKPKTKPRPKPKPKTKPNRPNRGNGAALAKTPQKDLAPTPSGDIFGDSGADYGSAGGRDLASEFNMDAASGGYTAPAAPAPAPAPGYAQPQPYAPPPTYYAPPPTYYAPPPTYYAPPPPTYAPAPVDPAPPPAVINDPGLPPGPAAPGRKKRKKKQSSGSNIFITLLPFGAGQFQNGDTLFGVLFLGSEAGALYYWYSNKQEAEAAVATANQYIEQKQAEGVDVAQDEASKVFIETTGAYAKEKEDAANLGLYGFVGLWGLGIVHALLTEPSEKKSKKKRRKRRRYSELSVFGEGGRTHFEYIEPIERSYDIQTQWNIGIMPGADDEPMMGAGFKVDF